MSEQPKPPSLGGLHPVSKLAWLVTLAVSLFVYGWWLWPIAVAMLVLLVLWRAGRPPWRLPGIRIWLTASAAIIAFQLVFVRDGNQIVGLVTTGGLAAGLRAAGRFLAILLLSTAFVATTEPFSLASALMGVGLPYRWGFVLATALRLAPMFRGDAQHIRRAQLVRGVAYDAWGPRRWWLLLRHLCLPLLVSALRTAQALAWSMEGRGFGLHPRRTYQRQIAFGRADIVAAALLAIGAAGAVWNRWLRG